MASFVGDESTWFGRLAGIALRVLLIAAFLILLGLALNRIRVILLPLMGMIVLASALLPIKIWLRRRGWSDLQATIGIVIAAAIVIGALSTLTIYTIATDFDEINDDIEAGITELGDWVIETFDVSQEQINSARDDLIQAIRDNASAVAGGVFSGVLRIIEIATGSLLLVFLLFWAIKDGDHWRMGIARRLRGQARRDFLRLTARIGGNLGSYLRGTIIVAFIDGFLIGLGLLILGVPLAAPLGVITFFAAFVPIAGAVLAGIAAVLVALATEGLVDAIAVGLLVLVVQQLEGNILQPIIVGRAVALHPIIIIIAVGTGGALWGILGAIIAVPIVSTAYAAVSYLLSEERVSPGSRRRVAEAAESVPDPPPPQ